MSQYKKNNFIYKARRTLKKISSVTKEFFIRMRVSPKRRRRAEGGREKADALTLFWFPLIFIYGELMLRLVTGTPFFSHIFLPIGFGFAFGMLFSIAIMLWKPKTNRTVTIILSSVTLAFYCMEGILRNTFSVFFSFASITKGTKGVVNNYLGDMIVTILGNFHIVVLMALPVVFYCLLGKKLVRPHRYKWPMAAAFLLGSLLLFGITTFFAATGKSGLVYGKNYDFNAATATFGLNPSLRLDLAYAGKKTGFVDVEPEETKPEAESETETTHEGGEKPTEAEKMISGVNAMDIDFEALAANEENDAYRELDLYAASQTPSDKNEYTGLFKGKNLILIAGEAFNDSFVCPELTPTLYRLLHNGIYCSDFYQPAWGGSTITGEYSLLLGLAPLNAVDTIYQTEGENLYFTMGNQLQRQGYFSIAFHNGDYDFYDRQYTHTNFGYDTWMALGSGLEEYTELWPSDDKFVDKTTDLYMDKSPFSIYWMSISGHCTYEPDDELTAEYYDQVNAVYPNLKETTKYYICYQMAFEKALTIMVERLEKAGIADDTVICMCPDHYPYGLAQGSFGNTDDYLSDLYNIRDDFDGNYDRSGMILWSGCLENENSDMACEVSTPVSSLDILPTLSNLFGVEYDSRLLPGRDILSEEAPLVFWLDRSWKTDKGYYNGNSEVFTKAEGAEIEDENAYAERISKIVSNKINFSAEVVDSDYYTHLFGPDE